MKTFGMICRRVGLFLLVGCLMVASYMAGIDIAELQAKKKMAVVESQLVQVQNERDQLKIDNAKLQIAFRGLQNKPNKSVTAAMTSVITPSIKSRDTGWLGMLGW